MNGRLLHAAVIAEQTLSFTIELEEPLGFRAGQSCDLILSSPPYDEAKGALRTFTIASPPAEEPRLTFATRQTGSAFKRSIADAATGLAVEVDGPWGDFLLHDDPARPAVFLAGGIGITPFRSMIADAIDRHLPHRLTLFYSSRTAATAAFLDEILGWERSQPNLRVIATITGDPPAAVARSGRLTSELIAEHVEREGRPVYYAAGTEAFVAAMRAALESIGVAADDIRTDEFPGY